MDASQTPANQRFDLNTGQEDIEDALSQAYKQGRISAGHILHTYLQWLKPEVCEFSYADWRVHNPVLEQWCHFLHHFGYDKAFVIRAFAQNKDYFIGHCKGKDQSARTRNYNLAKRDIETFYKRQAAAEQPVRIKADKNSDFQPCTSSPSPCNLPGIDKKPDDNEKGEFTSASMVRRSAEEVCGQGPEMHPDRLKMLAIRDPAASAPQTQKKDAVVTSGVVKRPSVTSGDSGIHPDRMVMIAEISERPDQPFAKPADELMGEFQNGTTGMTGENQAELVPRQVNRRKLLSRGYICRRCNRGGHRISECPTNMDPEYDPKPDPDQKCPLCWVKGSHIVQACPNNKDPLSLTMRRKRQGVEGHPWELAPRRRTGDAIHSSRSDEYRPDYSRRPPQSEHGRDAIRDRRREISPGRIKQAYTLRHRSPIGSQQNRSNRSGRLTPIIIPDDEHDSNRSPSFGFSSKESPISISSGSGRGSGPSSPATTTNRGELKVLGSKAVLPESTTGTAANREKELFPNRRGAHGERVLENSFAVSHSQSKPARDVKQVLRGLSPNTEPSFNLETGKSGGQSEHATVPAPHGIPPTSQVTSHRAFMSNGNGSSVEDIGKREADRFLEKLGQDLIVGKKLGTAKIGLYPSVVFTLPMRSRHVVNILAACYSHRDIPLPPRPTALDLWHVSERNIQGDEKSPFPGSASQDDLKHDWEFERNILDVDTEHVGLYMEDNVNVSVNVGVPEDATALQEYSQITAEID